MKHVSYSSLNRHRQCPQQWQFGAIQKFEPITDDSPIVPLEFGSWWHTLMAADSIERGRKHDTLRYVPNSLRTTDSGPELETGQITPGLVIAASIAWWGVQGTVVQEIWERTLGTTLPRRLEMAYAGWLDRWATAREQERPLAVEMGWGRDLPGADPRLVGYVDEVYLDLKRKLVVVRDHKTGKSLDASSARTDMMDSQLQLYAWGIGPEVKSWGFGPIEATAYDRVRSALPKTPKLTLTGTLSKSITDYDLATYVEWVGEAGISYPGRRKDGSGAGVYMAEPEIVAHLATPAARSAWFQRTLAPLNVHLIKAHLRAAVGTSEDMLRTTEQVEVTGEATRNLGGACKWCDFSSLCRAQMVGGPDGDYVLEEHGLQKREQK